MHPAKSVIFFTTASGVGYGLLFWFAILGLFDLLPSGPVFVIVGFGVALGLITAGLISSTFHLGHPERAWRAFSQWRTSWLSREGVAAVATYVPAAAWGISALIEGFGSPLSQTLGVVAAIGAAVTVYCTGMIYASLRTIPAWHNDWARAGYPIFAAMTGACLAVLLLSLFETGDITKFVFVSIVLFLVGGFAKRGYFEAIDE
ncbi:MAG: DmsC/YnfH family molybdoenzyme membrane anchor subunit, partial [Pseudomonadota bacterium]